MLRFFRLTLGFVVVVSIFAGSARALDWGWGGWGGWVDTPEGALARGMGQYYEGLGVLTKKTALADSINVDTMMRWNEYMYDAHLEATRRMVARRRANSDRVRSARNEILRDLRENPSSRDIENGNALNAAVVQLTDPRISSSVFRSATAPIDADVIRDIPFRNAAKAVTIVLSEVKSNKQWPAALDGERFAADKNAFDQIVDAAVKEDEEGDVSAATLTRAHDLVKSLRAKLLATPLDNVRASQEANRFLKTFAGLVRMLEAPDTREAFDELRKVKTTTLANLIAFMEVFNLRFGAATTPRQRLIYRQIFPTLHELRIRVVKGADLDNNNSFLSTIGLGAVGDFFSNFSVEKSEGIQP